MHKNLTIALLSLCLVLGAAASMPQPSMAQGTKRATPTQQTKRRVVSSARSAAPAPTAATEQRKELMFNQGSIGEALQGIANGTSLDPLQLGIGAVLALVIRSMLVRLWRLFLGMLRFLFARRRRAMATQPVPQVQYVAVPQPAPPQVPPMAPAAVMPPAPATA